MRMGGEIFGTTGEGEAVQRFTISGRRAYALRS